MFGKGEQMNTAFEINATRIITHVILPLYFDQSDLNAPNCQPFNDFKQNDQYLIRSLC